MMTEFKVGSVMPEFQGKQEGTLFQMDDSGMMFVVFFDSPTDFEIKQFDQGARFEFRFLELGKILFPMFKLGGLNWMDAPFFPQKSECGFERITDGSGYALTVMLVDSKTAVLKSLRLIGLGHEFSKDFRSAAISLRDLPFDQQQAQSDLARITQTYPTSQLVKMSRKYYRL